MIIVVLPGTNAKSLSERSTFNTSTLSSLEIIQTRYCGYVENWIGNHWNKTPCWTLWKVRLAYWSLVTSRASKSLGWFLNRTRTSDDYGRARVKKLDSILIEPYLGICMSADFQSIWTLLRSPSSPLLIKIDSASMWSQLGWISWRDLWVNESTNQIQLAVWIQTVCRLLEPSLKTAP